MHMVRPSSLSPRIVVYGRAYTPDFDTSKPRVNVFKSYDMTANLARATVGLPVYIEHDERYEVGHVCDAFVDEHSYLNVYLYLAGNEVIMERLPHAIGERYYQGLSMGTNVLLDEHSRCFSQVVDVIPTEVSIVRTPDRPRSFIFDYWHVPDDVLDVNAFVKALRRSGSSRLYNHHIP